MSTQFPPIILPELPDGFKPMLAAPRMQGLVVDDSHVIPMFANPEDSERWQKQQEELRRIAAGCTPRLLGELIKGVPAMGEVGRFRRYTGGEQS